MLFLIHAVLKIPDQSSRVIDEAKHLVESGVKEITLLGQNVNAYHGTGLDGREWSLAKLIWELDKIDGLARIRFTTSHPNDMTDDLIEAHGTCKKLMPYLHLPVQSGSNKILKRMNRSHDAESYLSLISKFGKPAQTFLFLEILLLVSLKKQTKILMIPFH